MKLRLLRVFIVISILIALGMLAPVHAGRVYPPWLRDDEPAPVYPRIIVDAAYVAEHYGCEGYELLSLYSLTGDQAEILANRYDGELTFQLNLEGTRWRDGHIPHSLPLDPTLLLDADGGVPDGATLRKTLKEHGPRPATRIDMESEFILCGGTVQLQSLAYLMLRQDGVDSVRIYPGGIDDWRSDITRPLVHIIETEQLVEMMSPTAATGGTPRDFVLMDLRHFTDFSAGSIPGAVNLPSHLFAEGFQSQLDLHWPNIDPAATPLVFFCYGTDCIRSRLAATKAAHLGWRNILWYHGGSQAWIDSGHELEMQPASSAY